MLSYIDFSIRILIAAVLGSLIGLEREWAHKTAGLRTHALVAIGGALLTIISVSGFKLLSINSELGSILRYDPSRIIAYTIAGIGFIGGGVILKRSSRVEGITTAATLWVVTAIGIYVGLGFIVEALISTAIIYFFLSVVYKLEGRIRIKRDSYNEKNKPKFDNKQEV